MEKSWTVMIKALATPKHLNKTCDRSHSHVHVMGQDTKPTEGYTVQIADAVHDAWTAELKTKVEHHEQIQAIKS